jgi:hypothetical protein
MLVANDDGIRQFKRSDESVIKAIVVGSDYLAFILSLALFCRIGNGYSCGADPSVDRAAADLRNVGIDHLVDLFVAVGNNSSDDNVFACDGSNKCLAII